MADRRSQRRSRSSNRSTLVEALEARQMLALFANGIDSDNLGKGAWGWNIRTTMTNMGFGVSDFTGFFNHLKNNLGLHYFITKAGDGGSVYNNAGGANYSTAVVNAAHAAGMKIFPYFYIYGTSDAAVDSEAAVFNQIIDTVGGDGAVIDIEGEWANAVGGTTSDNRIVDYFVDIDGAGSDQGIGKSQLGNGTGPRDSFFVAYSSFPYVSGHPEVPWRKLGDYLDSSMPQAYWDILLNTPSWSVASDKGPLSGPGGPTRMVSNVNDEYRFRSGGVFNSATYIKPVIMTGQSYATAAPSEIAEFYTAVNNSTTAVGNGGVAGYKYRSLNWFDLGAANQTTQAQRDAIAAGSIGSLPGAPTNPSPADNATNVPTGGLKLNWNDVLNTSTQGGATSYDVYFDGVFKANVTISEWTVSPAIFGGTHTWQVVARNLIGQTTGPLWDFTATAVLPGVPSNPSPAHNSLINIAPTQLNWDDTPNATGYDVFLGTSATPFTFTTTSSLSVNPSDGVRLWRIRAINSNGSTEGPQWQYTLDRFAPNAAYGNQTPANGASTLEFAITYTDPSTAPTGIDVSSIDDDDITVTGPNGYVATATLVGTDSPSNGTPIVATYAIPAPGGTWNAADNGTYTISQNGTQVRDVAGNYRTAGAVGSFSANLQDWAYMSGSTLMVVMDGSAAVQLGPGAGGLIDAVKGGTTLSFSGVADITVNGTTGSDTLEYAGTIAAPIQFNGGTGGDRLNVLGGTYALGTNASTGTTDLDVYVSGGATANFSSAQNIGLLSVAAGGSASSSGGLFTASKGISNAGVLALGAGASISGTGVVLTNTGALNVAAGTSVAINGDFTTSGTLAVEGAVSVTGGGTIGGSHTWGPGAIFNAGSSSTVFSSNVGGNLTINVSTGSVQFNSSQTLAALNLSGTGSAAMGADGNRLLHVHGLSIADNAGLNLNDNDLIVEYGTNPSAYADVRELVLGGFGTTTGIYSGTSDGSQILALFDNALIGATDWNGEPVGVNSVIGKYTYFGDVNIDGQVTGDDYTVIDANLDTTPVVGMEWLSGDGNLDGVVTGDDYTVIDANLGAGSGNPLSVSSGFSSSSIAEEDEENSSSLAEQMAL